MLDGIRITPRIGLVALLGTLGTLAFGATAASANQPDSSTCQFTGVAGTVVPAIPAPPAGKDLDSLYQFAGSASCVRIDDGEVGDNGGSLGPNGPYTISIASDGYVTNTVLGTGSVAGTAGVCSTDTSVANDVGPCPGGGLPAPVPPLTLASLINYFPPGLKTYTGVGFGIDFKNSVGQLGGGAVGPAEPGPPPATFNGNPDASDVLGTVSIVPSPPTVTPVGAFTVNGAFTTT